MFGSCKWNMRLLEGIEGVSICHAQSGEVFGKKKNADGLIINFIYSASSR